MRDVYVIGIDTLKFDRYLEKSIKDLSQETTLKCLKDAGLEKEAIEALWFSNSGWGSAKGQDCIRGQVALRDIGIEDIPITNVENACASGSTAFHQAWMGVASGLYETTMAVGAEKLYNSNKMAVFAGFLGGIDIENCLDNVKAMSEFSLTDEDRVLIEEFRSKYPEAPGRAKRKKSFSDKLKDKYKTSRDMAAVGVMFGEKIGYDTVYALQKFSSGDSSPFMDIYGYKARQHMKQYGTTVEQYAKVAEKSHFNGSLNPNAQYQFEVPMEKVLADRIVSFPITRSMCAPIGDGAASAILCSAAMVKKLGLSKQAVKVRASILGSGKTHVEGEDTPDIGERLAIKAYEASGIGPDEISFAEVHDATSFGEIIQVENLGFCPKGEGGLLAEQGETALNGRIPINTSGGLTSRGHPIGASGLGQIHELVTQLRQNAGNRQISKPRFGMAENGGGALGEEEAAMCMHILEAPSA
ncbi:MAG: thiolase [Moraxellaceae bacterium]|nr:MAG: thiolase [Moraxellaceae bacterium]